MGIPLHSKVRRMVRSTINLLLVKFSKKDINLQKISTDNIHRILIIRINYRIGNIIFLTPLINAITQKIPHAKIDILIGAKFIAPILQPMNNVNIVYDVPRKLLKNPFQLISKVKEINSNNYDLVISPIRSSGSANISTMLIKARYKLGFYSENIWSAANVVVPYPKKIRHEALKPLALLQAFEDDNKCFSNELDINLSEDEKLKGNKSLDELFNKNNIIRNNSTVIGIFRDARHEKKIKNEWWKLFIEHILIQDPSIIIIDILAPNDSEIIHQKSLSVSFQNLRDLGCFMSSLNFFICADTGPMHLASASGVPVIALFNATSADIYGPLGTYDRDINILGLSILEVVEQTFLNIKDINYQQ
ncbi:MAG: hypothetical protein COB35_02510 [Gammaproteobacteria bacterium]|nr:MAG: hypothetical protein COB35_02510 [Gammaproteobacteria bacterium]